MAERPDPVARLRLEVVIDAQTTLLDDVARTKQSIKPHGGQEIVVSMATRHSGSHVFSMSDADVFIVVSPGYTFDTRTVAEVDRTFATDEEIDVMFGPDSVASARPGWHPERLRSHDYLGGLVALRGSLARQLVGIAGDRYPHHRWDLVLRAGELARAVAISDHPLAARSATSAAPMNPETIRRGRQVLHDHLTRTGIRALAEATQTPGYFRTRRVLSTHPKVSVLIASPSAPHASLGDQLESLGAVIGSIGEYSSYQPLEVVVVTDDTIPSAALHRLRELCEGSAEVLPVCRPGAPRSRHLDIAASLATGDVFVILDDTCVVDDDPDWLETMVALAIDPSIGAACCGPAESAHPSHDGGVPVQAETTAIAGSCIAIRRDVLTALGGLSDDPTGSGLPASLAAHGWTCVHTPFARLRRHVAHRPISTA